MEETAVMAAVAAANDGVGDNNVCDNDVCVAMADTSGVDGGGQQHEQQWLS